MTQQIKRENFTQLPNVLFDGCCELEGLERWLCACLARLCWIPEKKYQISLRLIEKVSGISAGSLCSCEGKTPHEGMLFKLHRLGYIILERKDEKKNAPYIIQLTNRLWEDNTPQSVFSINAHADVIVYSAKSVFYKNTSVSQENTDVFVENAHVFVENTEGVLKDGQKPVEEPRNTSNTSNTKREGEPTPLSCTREIREIGASLEDVQKKPSWVKTDRKVASKKPAATYTKVLVSPPPPPTPAMKEERPLTKNEEQYLREQERSAIWKVIEEVLHIPVPYRVRTDIKNTRGMDALIEDHYSPHDIKRALTDLDSFQRKNILVNFTLENLHLKMPGLLAAREEPPKAPAHSSRPLGIAPPLGGRRLDSGPGMMPGLKGVRHA